MYQVIIAGGGPAGTFLAYLLAKEGLEVLLAEKEKYPRPKTCAGGISPRALKLLPFEVPVIENVVDKALIIHGVLGPCPIVSPRPFLYMVDRARFDMFMMEKARAAGAVILEGSKAEYIEFAEKGVILYAGGARIQGLALVGADGAFSTIARILHKNFNRRVCTFACELQIPIKTKEDESQGTIKIDYSLPQGYAWVFPKREYLSIGVASAKRKINLLPDYLSKMMQREDFKKVIGLQKPRYWVIPAALMNEPLHHGRVLLAGDAAGLANPLTGEGIFSALYSARVAAEVILRQIKKSEPDFGDYSNLIQKSIGKELHEAFRVARWFYPASNLIHRLVPHLPALGEDLALLLSGEIDYTQFLKHQRKQLWGSLFQ